MVSQLSGSSNQSSDRLSFPPSLSRPKQPESISSGYGHQFAVRDESLAIFLNKKQAITRTYDFSATGYWLINGATIPEGSVLGATNQFWAQLYNQQVYSAEGDAAFEHTPPNLFNFESYPKYINDYVKVGANLTMLANAYSIDGWNRASFGISDGLYGTRSYRGRIQALWALYKSIPMYPYFRSLAAELGRMVYDRDFGMFVLRLYPWSANSKTLLATTPSFNPLAAVLDDAVFNWTDGAVPGDIHNLLIDCTNAVRCLLGDPTLSLPNDNTDLIGIRRLHEKIGPAKIPDGFPQPMGLELDPDTVDRILRREWFGVHDSRGGLSDALTGSPFLPQPQSAQTEVKLLRRGLGDLLNRNEFILTGMDCCLGKWLLGATGTIGAHYFKLESASIQAVSYGALISAEGGVGVSPNSDTNPGLVAAYRDYDILNGWTARRVAGTDMGNGAALANALNDHPIPVDHESGLSSILASQITALQPKLNENVGWQFVQPLSSVYEVLLRQMETVFDV